MKVKAERKENSQMVLEVEAEPEEVERSMDGAYRSLVGRANVPGFRRGKAPRDMLERYIGKGALLERAMEKLVPQLLSQAIEEQGIEAIARPEVEILQADPVIFRATIQLRPTVELGSYKELDIPSETVTVSEEEVNSFIEQLRYQQAPWEPVERPVKPGDLLTIDVEGSVEGQPLLDRKDLEFQVRQGLPFPVPGFAEKLEGLERGQDSEFSISIPADAGVSELAGKECHFKVRVGDIKEKKLPDLNDEFARSIGQGFETMSEVTDAVTSDIRRISEENARKRYEEKVLDAVVEGSRVEFPPVLVEKDIDRFIEEQESELSQNRMSLEDYLRNSKKSREDLREELRPMARTRVARAAVLSRLVEAEDIVVGSEEIDEEVARMVKREGEQGEALGKFFQSEDARNSLESLLLTRKALALLVEIASGKVKSEAGSVEDASGEPESTPGESEAV